MRTSLYMAMKSRFHAAQSFCHSTRVTSRWTLKTFLEFRWGSLSKWLETNERIETNFSKLRIRLNFNMAYSRRQKGRWEFLYLFFFHLLTSRVVSLPMIFIATWYDLSLSVTIVFITPSCYSWDRWWGSKNCWTSLSSLGGKFDEDLAGRLNYMATEFYFRKN